MASSSPTKIPGVLALNDENLTDLRERFLSVFGSRPIPDNDFHVVAEIVYDKAAWSASLQIETTEHGAELVPYAHSRQHSNTAEEATTTVIRQLWPDAAKFNIKRASLLQKWEMPLWRLPSPSPGQVWSFTSPEPWAISFPVIASIMCLLSNPDKKPASEHPDRDIAWCVDSMQGFCRFANPDKSKRPLSYTFGTYGDQWMYLHFIAHTYCKVNALSIAEPQVPKGSGMMVDRPVVTVPNVGTFRERRVSVFVRTAAGKPKQPVPFPSEVAVISSNFGHMEVNIKHGHWTEPHPTLNIEAPLLRQMHFHLIGDIEYPTHIIYLSCPHNILLSRPTDNQTIPQLIVGISGWARHK
ncbi:uncharacterized protein PG986_011674 [Apiospora aurea]|uniref:Uncharacterized protein n=1 Tax=Apiospora aurea TaxID=335848 RepID=A0ABR1PYV8_9PEZI